MAPVLLYRRPRHLRRSQPGRLQETDRQCPERDRRSRRREARRCALTETAGTSDRENNFLFAIPSAPCPPSRANRRRSNATVESASGPESPTLAHYSRRHNSSRQMASFRHPRSRPVPPPARTSALTNHKLAAPTDGFVLLSTRTCLVFDLPASMGSFRHSPFRPSADSAGVTSAANSPKAVAPTDGFVSMRVRGNQMSEVATTMGSFRHPPSRPSAAPARASPSHPWTHERAKSNGFVPAL